LSLGKLTFEVANEKFLFVNKFCLQERLLHKWYYVLHVCNLRFKQV